MTGFDGLMTARQIAWRKSFDSACEPGWQNNRTYEHILPRERWRDGVWEPIRDALDVYLKETGVQRHTGVHNLKSSWVLCANLYFPFGRTPSGRAIIADFLQRHVHEDIESVDSIDLEYAEERELSPAALLGESGGSRGSGQTSPDLGILVNGGRGLLLIENKLAEHSFYRCSARRTRESSERPGNPDPNRCNHPRELIADAANLCHQAAWGRRYWEILSSVADAERLAALPHCPAAHAGYQLLRQQALAEGIARSGKYDLVISAVAYDARNKGLQSSMGRSGIPSIEAWGGLFRGAAAFGTFTHQDWFRHVAGCGEREWLDWLAYADNRYGLGGDGSPGFD